MICRRQLCAQVGLYSHLPAPRIPMPSAEAREALKSVSSALEVHIIAKIPATVVWKEVSWNHGPHAIYHTWSPWASLALQMFPIDAPHGFLSRPCRDSIRDPHYHSRFPLFASSLDREPAIASIQARLPRGQALALHGHELEDRKLGAMLTSSHH